MQLHRESIIIHNIMSSGVQGLAPLLLIVTCIYVPLYKLRDVERFAGKRKGHTHTIQLYRESIISSDVTCRAGFGVNVVRCYTHNNCYLTQCAHEGRTQCYGIAAMLYHLYVGLAQALPKYIHV